MRLFVALEISDEIRGEIASLIDRLSADLTRGGNGTSRPLHIGWVAPERLHLTLQFIGEVRDDLVAAIEQRLAPAFPLTPFELELAGLGVFPASGPPRVIWIGVAAGGAQAAALQAETVRRLEGLPIRTEDRPFSGHVTLGRVRTGGAQHRRRLQNRAPVQAGRCTIDHVTLFQSRLSPKGATYHARLRVPLAP